jgi:hypothetical protein
MATSLPRTESDTDVRTKYPSMGARRQTLAAASMLILLRVLAAGEASAGDDRDFEDVFGAYTHRIEGVTVGAGDAPANNTAAQIVNPWPAYARDRHILSESRRMIGAIERYHANSGAKPLSVQDSAKTGTGAQDTSDATPDAGTGTRPSPPSNAATGE